LLGNSPGHVFFPATSEHADVFCEVCAGASSSVYIYMYIYIDTIYIKLYRQQAEVIQNHENEHVSGIGQGEARHRKNKRLKLGGGQAYDCSSD
jgi:hypothetical protein